MDTVLLSRRSRGVASLLVVASLFLAAPAGTCAQSATRHIELMLADYRFAPAELEILAGQPVILTLSNKDAVTPHNFTLHDAAAGLDIDTNIAAGTSIAVEFTPLVAGTYTFYCNKKLPLMKSHRAHGMQGTLTVLPAAAD